MKKLIFKRVFYFSILLGILFYIGLHFAVYKQQEGLIFFPQKLASDYKYTFPGDFEELWLQSKEERLNAVYFKVPNPKGIIVFLHGNNGNITTWYSSVEELLRYQYDVITFDYRGYGKSSGLIRDEKDLYDDAWAVVQYARKKYKDEKIILYGRSLGTGLAIKAGTLFKPSQIILETPYLNLKYIAQRFYPFIFSYMLKYPLRAENWAPFVRSPVTVVHGTNDELIRIEDAEKLFTRFPYPRRFYRIEGGFHSDLASYPLYHQMLDDVLKTN